MTPTRWRVFRAYRNRYHTHHGARRHLSGHQRGHDPHHTYGPKETP